MIKRGVVMKSVTEKSKECIAASFVVKKRALQVRIVDIKEEMIARNTLNSTMCVNAICKACVEELHESTEMAFTEITRAFQLCGAEISQSISGDLTKLFEKELSDIKTALQVCQEEATGDIIKTLPDKKIPQFGWLDREEKRLGVKYTKEIAVYVDTLRRSSGWKLVNRLKTFFSR